MSDLIERTADILANATSAVALTGAGISVESGIPPFRGKGGLWEKIDPMKYAHIDAFLDDPETVWEVLIKDMKTILDTARPNPGHTSLVDLEQLGILKTVITQNVDGLHQMAGNSDVIEFHGNFAWQALSGLQPKHRNRPGWTWLRCHRDAAAEASSGPTASFWRDDSPRGVDPLPTGIGSLRA
jgi:NAD-dependent SIR2 family protein deacetylase